MKNFNPSMIIQLAVVLAVLYVIYLFMRGFKNIATTIGGTLGTSATEQQIASETEYKDVEFLDPVKGFKVLADKGYGGTKVNQYFSKINFNSSDADNISKNIYDAKKLINDDENQVYMAFNRIPTKIAVSLVSHRFKRVYGKDLQQYLLSFLNASEFSTVLNIIKKKPLM
ncbi:MAG: hypothetical protein N2558_04910 [Patescibacteria group bacterium]|nr:hypothetical protein [Patescibacteria group bacterium]